VPDRNLPRLSRRLPDMPEAPPVRMVHLGIGNFHRAHQAWYTANAPDAAEWGIAGFTSRRPDMAEQLAPQDGLYTLITRGGTGDDFSVIGSIAAVHPSTDHAAYLDYLRRSEVAVVTISVHLRGKGAPVKDPVQKPPVLRLRIRTSTVRSRACSALWTGTFQRTRISLGRFTTASTF
jgi:mannitol-1-phosphate/altronate dehydrogenase